MVLDRRSSERSPLGRRSLVQTVMERIRKEGKRTAGSDENPTTGSDLMAKRHPLLLWYKDRALEEQFVRFIHKSPLIAVLVLHVTVAIAVLLEAVSRKELSLTVPLFVLSLLAVIAELFIHVLTSRLTDENTVHRVLTIERAMVIVMMMFSALGNIAFSLEVSHDCANEFVWTPVGPQPKAYREGYCWYWSSFVTIIFGVLGILRVIRFCILIPLAVLVMLAVNTFWLVPTFEPKSGDTAGLLIRGNILSFAGCAIACFIRYNDEMQQRRHFMAQEALVDSAVELNSKREETLERFLLVLPEGVAARLRTGQWNHSQIDRAEDATVLVTSVHDFVGWSSSLLPLNAAAFVGLMHSLVDAALHDARLERVGRLGDTTIAVGNLLQRFDSFNVPALTLDAGRSAMARVDSCIDRLPLVAAAHLGILNGELQGQHHVRYEVRGPAVDAARKAVQLCNRKSRFAASEAIIKEGGSGLEVNPCDEELVVELDNGALVKFVHINPPRGDQLGVVFPDVVLNDMNPLEAEDLVSNMADLLAPNGSCHVGATSSPKAELNAAGETTGSASSGSLFSVDPLEIVTDRLGFYRFADTRKEKRFLKERTKELPHQAAKIWLGYAAYVALILVVLMMDLYGPYAMTSVGLLLFAILSSVCLAVTPRIVKPKVLKRIQPVWTSVGVVVPLLTVFGCALSRPSLVGHDIRAYVALGAFLRSFCFNDARLQVVFVPVFSLIGSLHYLLPGAHVYVASIPTLWMFIFATVVAARNRAGNERKNHRRGLIAAAVLEETEEVARVQRGLMQSSMPRCVFDAAADANFEGPNVVFQSVSVVMVIRAARPTNVDSLNISSGLDRVLDRVVGLQFFSTAGVLGDDAIVVGPVPTSLREANALQDSTASDDSLQEGLQLGLLITGGPNPPAQSVLVDQDTTAHILKLGSRPGYSLLGASAMRLISIGASVSGVVMGLLVTDRVKASLSSLEMSDELEVMAQAPMSVRGQGIVRWNRLSLTSHVSSTV